MGGASIRDIPVVREFLLNESVLEHFRAVQQKFGLDIERAAEYLALTRAVLDGVITPDNVPELIAEAFGVDKEKAIKIACDVVGYRLLPLEQFFPGVAQKIEAWGGNVDDYGTLRVGKRQMTPEQFAGKLTEDLGLDFSEVLVKRLGYLVDGFYSGERSKDSTLTFFARPQTIGGLGLLPDDASRLMDTVVAEKDSTILLGVGEHVGGELKAESGVTHVGVSQHSVKISASSTLRNAAPRLPSAAPGVYAWRRPSGNTSTPSSHGGGKGEVVATAPIAARDFALHAKKAAELRPAAERADVELDVRVQKAVDDASAALQQARIAKKTFADIVRTVLKGVRDIRAAEDMLETVYGAKGEVLANIVRAIPQSSAPALRISQLPAPKTPPFVRGGSEATQMSRKFAAMTGTMPKEHIEPIMPGSRVSAARTQGEEAKEQDEKIDEKKIDVAEASARPEKITPQLTRGSVPPPSATGGPKTLTDVRATTRLMGPVEQLRAMQPADFRRFAPSPADAAQKVEDIISGLESVSYEDRVKGIAAWRASAVNQLYLVMAGDALESGTTLAEIAGKRRGKGEESLSPAEIRAISMLNAKIRF